MTTTITSGADTLAALAVTEYASSARSGNRVHNIMDRANPNAILRVAGLRTGTLTVQFGTEATSRSAELLHCAAGKVFRMVCTERPSIDMYYIVNEQGQIQRRLQPSGHWTLQVDFQEVTL